LGKISYSFYLLHAIIGASFVNYLSHHVSGGFQKVLLIIAGFLISLGSAYLLYRFVEKPSHNWAKKIP
jgi:peptidoglycan/LPS O-acetylase OafA/YrhL